MNYKKEYEVYAEKALNNALDIMTELIINIDNQEYKEDYNTIEKIRTDIFEIWHKYYEKVRGQ